MCFTVEILRQPILRLSRLRNQTQKLISTSTAGHVGIYAW